MFLAHMTSHPILSSLSHDTCMVLAGVIPLFFIAVVADTIRLQTSDRSVPAMFLQRLRMIRWAVLPIFFVGLEIAFALGVDGDGYEGPWAYTLWILFIVMLFITLAGWFVSLVEAWGRYKDERPAPRAALRH